MAAALLSSLPQSYCHVRPGARVFVLRATPTAAVRIDAKWFAPLAQHDGNQRSHRSGHLCDDAVRGRGAIPACAFADYSFGGVHWRLALLRSASIRGDVLG